MDNYCVYKHTSPSGKVYIGITGDKPENRWREGRGYKSIPFSRAISKYGWENFRHEILYSGLSLEEANQKEIETIALYDSTNPKKGYNITRGGNLRFVGENHPLYGKKRSPQTVEKIAATRRGKPWTINQRKASLKYYETHRAPNYGRKSSPETREKLRISHLGKVQPHSEETIEKISRGHDGHKKPVIQYSLDGELIARHDSVSAAGYTISPTRTIPDRKNQVENIRQCCKGTRKTAYGYKWAFEEVSAGCMISSKSNNE